MKKNCTCKQEENVAILMAGSVRRICYYAFLILRTVFPILYFLHAYELFLGDDQTLLKKKYICTHIPTRRLQFSKDSDTAHTISC